MFVCCFESPLGTPPCIFILSLQSGSKVLEDFYFFPFVPSSVLSAMLGEGTFYLFVCPLANDTYFYLAGAIFLMAGK